MDSKDVQIDWLRAFVAIVDTGSMTAAGRQVSRSQSAVSMQLKKLEDSIGRPLINREPRPVSLTPAGYDLLGHARKVLEHHAALVLAMHGGTLSGRTSIGAPDDYALPYLVPVLRNFAARFPDVEVTLVCEESTALWAKVDRGEIDLALVTRDARARGELLFREPLVWAAVEQHEAWKRIPLPIAVHALGAGLRADVLAALSSRQRAYRMVYNSPNLAGQLAIAQSGIAVAVLTRCNVPAGLKIVSAHEGMPGLPMLEVVLARSKESEASRAADAMHQHIIGSLREPLVT